MTVASRAYAFFTDIHGNSTALDAVLDDINEFQQRRGVENLTRICLGDSFDGGPDPLAVLKTLEDLKCPHLRGNHEDYLLDYIRHPESEKYARPLWKFIPWTVAQLGPQLVNFEKKCLDRWSALDDPFVAVHAALHGNNRVPDFFAAQSSLSPHFVETFAENLSQWPRVYLNGHSHYLGRHIDPQTHALWLNCGSVGYPFVEKLNSAPDAALATWVWIEVYSNHTANVINRRVPYSSDHLLRRYVESGALEQCAPFSFAIAAQSLFNQDVVYPFFQKVKKISLTPDKMAVSLVEELRQQSVFERINRLLRTAGFQEVKGF